MRNARNPSVILSDDSSPFKGAEIVVAPTEHCNAIAGESLVTVRLYPPREEHRAPEREILRKFTPTQIYKIKPQSLFLLSTLLLFYKTQLTQVQLKNHIHGRLRPQLRIAHCELRIEQVCDHPLALGPWPLALWLSGATTILHFAFCILHFPLAG